MSLADVLQEAEIARRAAGGREERGRVGGLLGAVADEVLHEHPSRERPAGEAGLGFRGQVGVRQASDPRTQRVRFDGPPLSNGRDGPEVLGPQLRRLAPLRLGSAFESQTPAPLDVELVDEGRAQAAGRDVIVRGPRPLREMFGGIKKVPIRPPQVLDEQPQGDGVAAGSSCSQADSSSG